MIEELTTDWQTLAALAVVALTALVFVYQFAKKISRKSSGGCAGSCDCKLSKPKSRL